MRKYLGVLVGYQVECGQIFGTKGETLY